MYIIQSYTSVSYEKAHAVEEAAEFLEPIVLARVAKTLPRLKHKLFLGMGKLVRRKY